MDKNRSYKEQYCRLENDFEKLVPVPRTLIDPSQIERDFYDFFVSCWQMREWILADKSIRKRITRRKIDDFIEQSEYLKFAMDIANKFKHMELDNKPWVSRNLILQEIGITYDMYNYTPSNQTMVGIRDISKEFDPGLPAYEYAIGCKNEWDVFLRKNKLLNGKENHQNF